MTYYTQLQPYILGMNFTLKTILHINLLQILIAIYEIHKFQFYPS